MGRLVSQRREIGDLAERARSAAPPSSSVPISRASRARGEAVGKEHRDAAAVIIPDRKVQRLGQA